MRAAYATRPAAGNGGGAFVIVAPDLIAAAPYSVHVAFSPARESVLAPTEPPFMNAPRPEPNLELHQPEPFRVAFALLALVLGAVAALQI